jgi:hypothetical protein
MATSLAAVVIMASLAAGGEEKQAKPSKSSKPLFGEELERPVTVNWSGVALTQALAELSKQAGIAIALDPELPASVGATPVSLTAKDVRACVVLGNVLRAAGLRYAGEEGGLFVSTPSRVATRLLSGGTLRSVPESEPMSAAEAASLLTPQVEDPLEEMPWLEWELAVYNPATGLMDYLPPPVFGWPSDRRDEPRFRYTDRPSYLKPDYLDSRAPGASMTERELLLRLVELLRRNPEWLRSEIVGPAASGSAVQ